MGDLLAAINYMVIGGMLPVLLLHLFSRDLGWRSRVLSVPMAVGIGSLPSYWTCILGPLDHARFIAATSKPGEPKNGDIQCGCDAWMGVLLPTASAMYVMRSTNWFPSKSSLASTPDEGRSDGSPRGGGADPY